MTVGYLATDKAMATKFAARGPATARDLCGGPAGAPQDRRTSFRLDAAVDVVQTCNVG